MVKFLYFSAYTIKTLGVTFTSNLSLTLRVQSVIVSCAQTLRTLHVPREHGLCDYYCTFRLFSGQSRSLKSCMRQTRSRVLPTPCTDRQKITAFTDSSIRTGYCLSDLLDFHELYTSSDEQLFTKITVSSDRILRALLPLPAVQNYSLRPWCGGSMS